MHNTIVVITGGFDPLHSGHISYINAARKLGNTLVIGVNSDEWLVRKKGRSFMPFEDRISIIQSLQGVDYAIPFNDKDNSAKDAILWARKVFPKDKIIFANGGDRTNKNTPEMAVCDELGITMLWEVGGGKIQSSSEMVANANAAKKETR